MSCEGWISAKEALARLMDLSDDPKRQLIDCARLDGSWTRAARRFQDGQALKENTPLQYQFWEAVAESGEMDWNLGVFSYSAPATDKRFDAGTILHWKAVGVEFFWPEIAAQLGLQNGDAAATFNPLPKAEPSRWQKQCVSDDQKQLFKFFGIAGQCMPDGANPLNKTALRQRYREWMKHEKYQKQVLGRTSFEKMLGRYLEGYRVTGNRWESPQ